MTELILIWILSLPQAWKEEVPEAERERQVRPIAEAIARWAEDRELAAIAVSVAWHETKFLERIQAGNCKKFECDRGRARGYFQPHEDASPLARERWDDLVGLGDHNVDAQAQVALQLLRRGRKVCRTLEGAASYYAVGHCRFPGAKKRGKLAEMLLLRNDEGRHFVQLLR